MSCTIQDFPDFSNCLKYSMHKGRQSIDRQKRQRKKDRDRKGDFMNISNFLMYQSKWFIDRQTG